MQNRPHQTILPGVSFKPKARKPRGAEATWINVRTISALFVLAVSFLMLVPHLTTAAIDPLTSPDLRVLKEKLHANPADETTKQDIRNLDLQLRGQYFQRLSRSGSGAYLLLLGLAVFIIAAKQCARYRKQLPMPDSRTSVPVPAHAARIARWSVSAVGTSAAAVLLLLSFGRGSALTEPANSEKGSGSTTSLNTASVPDAAPEAELKLNWPRFRGPGGNGYSEATNLPTTWDPATGTSIAWKAPVPAPGFNSPIIWSNRFFFSGGDASKREVFCYDTTTGQLVWRQPVSNVPGSPATPPEVPETTGYSASSMATDGRRVYVIFATGDVAAFTLEGKFVWAKSFGPLKNPYGHASSLATWRDRLILLLDQAESEDGKSKLYALDGRTGQIIWQTPRKVGSSWATPITFESAGQPQVVALAIPWAISYRLTDGGELWRVECPNGEVTPSPIFAAGLAIVPSPSEKLLAIRPDGHGDVTKTHVTWSTEENVPDVTSPVSNGELVFGLTTPGVLTCFDSKDGKKLWEHDFEMEFHSSPAIAGSHLYLFGQKGTAIVTDAARQFKEVSRVQMPDVFHASPAFCPDRIILRGVTNLWGLASPPKK